MIFFDFFLDFFGFSWKIWEGYNRSLAPLLFHSFPTPLPLHFLQSSISNPPRINRNPTKNAMNPHLVFPAHSCNNPPTAIIAPDTTVINPLYAIFHHLCSLRFPNDLNNNTIAPRTIPDGSTTTTRANPSRTNSSIIQITPHPA